jgi:hypothetical protein
MTGFESKIYHRVYILIIKLYITHDEFLIRNGSYFTNIIILQAKLVFIYLFIYTYKLFFHLFIYKFTSINHLIIFNCNFYYFILYHNNWLKIVI